MDNKQLFIETDTLPDELKDGIRHLSKALPLTFSARDNAVKLCFTPGGKGIDIGFANNAVNILYGDKTDAFRALGLVNARKDEPQNIHIHEVRRMQKVFVMLDASRNAVLNSESAVQWFCFMALAGINGFMFYTEDTFEVPGEKLFGYLRGRLSATEISGLDGIADALGIEMVPCIQALAHLQRILHYDCYQEIKDTESVMLCDSQKTIDFVEKLIKTASAPYRSKRIHIGMDEAWDLGRGTFLTKNGYQPPSEIVARHLQKVMEIIRKQGLKPMMWADMFFRAINRGLYYSDTLTEAEMSKTYKGKVDQDIDLVYWDYYRFSQPPYDYMIKLHEAINGQKPVVAPGIHTWSRFWASAPYSLNSLTPCLKSCFEHQVKEMIVTIWGDDGTEADFFSALPYLQYAADVIYTGDFSLENTRINLKGSFGIDFDAWNYAGQLDCLDFLGENHYPNISKSLLWEDPLIGLLQPQLEGKKLNTHYRQFADKLGELVKMPGNERLDHVRRVADILADKADLPTVLRQAYLNKDFQKLRSLLDRTVPEMIAKIQAQRDAHRRLWLKNYKPFGWDALERRYGGLLACFANLQFRLQSYLDGECDKLEELEAERCKMFDCASGDFPYIGRRQYIESSGYLAFP